MAEIFFENSGEFEHVKDGSKIDDACRRANIPFSCNSGCCGTCKVDITEGKENLNPMTESEKDILDESTNNRLACQVKILSGKVKIRK